jgi:leucyl-tRNA synthetase
MKRYNPSEIEPKWQKYWEESNTYTANLHSDKPKYIAMSMFNYPSGFLHIGHALNYTISDVKARFKRQQGYESYHPVGWDSFGLPAENYAIKAGVSPQESMGTLIPNYRINYRRMGWSNDWEKEIATHKPEYYKWTQWIFSQMFKHGLAYQDARSQWWCDSCQTVLANEQVIDGRCWRHDNAEDPQVEKREVKQWFFKITEYADELLEATDALDWTDSVKLAQKNWIGKSIGAEVSFTIVDSKNKIDVFTTRPDTIFGATFLVLAPESDLLESLVAADQKTAVAEYVKASLQKTEIERQVNKEKTGVFTGSYAINPATNEQVPIWVADYVLDGYGTGAIMAVPAHDDRDYEFATKFGLDTLQVVDTESGYLMNSGEFNGLKTVEAQEKIISWLKEKGQAADKINYKMRDWSVTRQRYWGAPTPIIHCPDCGPVSVPDKDLPVVLPELEDFKPSGDGRSALARATDWLQVDCPECGKPSERETDTLDTYICSSWYMMRYFDPTNQEAIFDKDVVNKWMPIDFYNGGDHATAHLLYARFVTRFFNKIGLVDEPEPFKQMLFNGKVTAADGTMFSKSKGNGIDPLEIIDSGYGADALRMYLMFASPLELWTKWDEKGVPGTYRFLNRVWSLVHEYSETSSLEGELIDEASLRFATHSAIKKTTEDIEENRYNTAIATFMTLLNELYKLKTKQFGKNDAWQSALETLTMLIAPFAPHIAEELWVTLGHSDSIHADYWPELNEAYLVTGEVTMAVQINGKVRAEITVPVDADASKVQEIAMAQENVQAHIKGKEIRKFIYIPGKITNIVV